MVKIKLAFRKEDGEDAQEYVQEKGDKLNVQNFGDVSLMETSFDLNASGPIGGVLVQPVNVHEDGDVFTLPFDLENQNVNEDWIEAENDKENEESDQVGGLETEDARRRAARRAMNLKTQESSMSMTMTMSQVDDSALAAVNMTLESDMMDATQQQEEENWHAFDPEEVEEEEEEDGERHVFKDGDGNHDNDPNTTKDTDVSNIELVRADTTDGQISLVSKDPLLFESTLPNSDTIQ